MHIFSHIICIVYTFNNYSYIIHILNINPQGCVLIALLDTKNNLPPFKNLSKITSPKLLQSCLDFLCFFSSKKIEHLLFEHFCLQNINPFSSRIIWKIITKDIKKISISKTSTENFITLEALRNQKTKRETKFLNLIHLLNIFKSTIKTYTFGGTKEHFLNLLKNIFRNNVFLHKTILYSYWEDIMNLKLNNEKKLNKKDEITDGIKPH